MYCDMIQDVPLRHLKYLGESHFASREVRRNRRVGPKGEPVYAVNNDRNYAVTLIVGVYYGQLNRCSSSTASTA